MRRLRRIHEEPMDYIAAFNDEIQKLLKEKPDSTEAQRVLLIRGHFKHLNDDYKRIDLVANKLGLSMGSGAILTFDPNKLTFRPQLIPHHHNFFNEKVRPIYLVPEENAVSDINESYRILAHEILRWFAQIDDMEEAIQSWVYSVQQPD